MKTKLSPEQIAGICHDANRLYCLALGDESIPPWHVAPDWQRESATKGVLSLLSNPILTPEETHFKWSLHKQQEGWSYGLEKDPEKKEHPCMLPYDQLPDEHKAKDELFRGIVIALGVNVYYKSYPEARSSFVPRGVVVGITPDTEVSENHE